MSQRKDSMIDYIPDTNGWESFFRENYKILDHISTILDDKDDYLPRNEDIFNIFHKIKPDEIKIVIIVKEPYSGLYEGEPITDGIPLSMNRNILINDDNSKIPNDLKIVFRKLKSLDQSLRFQTFCLDKWVEQGVFLMNTCFTVETFKNNSHIKRNFWKQFVFKLIKKIANSNPDCIFLIWGNDASFMNSYIPNSCYKFVSDYPSVMNDKFTGHLDLMEANKILLKQKKQPINFSTF